MEVLEKVIAGIDAEKQTEVIYKRAFPRVAAFIYRLGGSFDEARDVFHDALVIYYDALSQKKIKIKTTDEAYLLGIAKHLWIRKHNDKRHDIPLSELENEILIPSDYFPTIENQRLLRFLKSAGKKCMDLLRVFYYEQSNIKKLAVKLGYPNEHSASVQKYKCLEKIRETIKQKSLSYEDFVE